MAHHSKTAAGSAARSGGIASWGKGRKIYLAVGVLACLAGILMMVFSR